MKIKSILKNPRYLFTTFLTLFVTIGLIAVFLYQKAQIPSFQEFGITLYQTDLADDGLSVHFLYKDTPPFDLTLSNSLPLYEGVRDEQAYTYAKEQLAILSKIAIPKDPVLQRDYNICKDTLKCRLKLSQYPYLAEPLSPNSGLHVEILLLLCAYPFYENADITQYLSLLRSFDSFMNSLISYETEKKDAGLFMSYSASQQIIDQCEILMKNTEELPCSSLTELYELLDDPQAPISFLTASFLKRLLPFYDKKLLTEAEILDLYQEHQSILRNTIAPSYERLADTLWLLQDPSIPAKGLALLPDGKEYYEALLSQETGSSKSVAEMKQLLLDNLVTEYGVLKQVVSAYLTEKGDDDFSWDFPITVPDQQIEALKKEISDSFPDLSEYSDSEICCLVQAVTSGLSDYTAPAFYIQTPVDDLLHQTIYINYAETTDSLSLFTTLAHEGYPGHLYQHVISSYCYEKEYRSPFRLTVSYPGFQEGWAVYVEFLAYEKAKDFCDNTLQKAYIELLSSDRKVSLCLYALCDIMIHDEGADYQTIHHFLSDYGITSFSSTKAIYEYIVGSPANYMKYYMGYLEMKECKDLAKKEWGKNYSDLAFHRFMLEFGTAPFSIIKEEIQKTSSSS